jgi:hypothetical protein
MKQIVLPVQDFTNKAANKDTLNEAVPKVKMLEQSEISARLIIYI